jgi:hypothetical protein
MQPEDKQADRSNQMNTKPDRRVARLANARLTTKKTAAIATKTAAPITGASTGEARSGLQFSSQNVSTNAAPNI